MPTLEHIYVGQSMQGMHTCHHMSGSMQAYKQSLTNPTVSVEVALTVLSTQCANNRLRAMVGTCQSEAESRAVFNRMKRSQNERLIAWEVHRS
jgi:hypothetical protein